MSLQALPSRGPAHTATRGRAPDWHIDAVFYELSVKTFFDSNHDGIGDFRGLTEKLGYLQDLGVTALWLMPFYPSPWRDDGYDISDFRDIHPSLGTVDEFRRFLDEVHRRGLYVMTDLVVNHTSEEHPWFQAAREAPAQSPLRKFYVWSDTERPYGATRSHAAQYGRPTNWSWDPKANAFYWHRFSRHQPDLNYDNPAVVEEMAKVVRFWFDLGVDGISLVGAPLLIERESSVSEGLPETHAVLKAFRRAIPHRHQVLASGVNAWPTEARSYFGESDECQLSPNLPLAQRLFLALRLEERYPLQHMLQATPQPPHGCQWITLLRNHDELTLGLATDEEQDYMYREYAWDPRMRMHPGILRRLAPLLENSRSRLELMFSLLFALPGAPLIYYGDEIGMGDNVYQAGRNAVRTPMQWSSDRNAGFSQADFARLIAPPVMDSVYGYQAVNVEAQRRDASSQFHAVRRMVGLRKKLQSLSRGSFHWLEPANPHGVAFVRSHGEEVVLVVANLSASLQPVELDLSLFAGLTPVDAFGRSVLPPITDRPYFFTLAPYVYHWFLLQKDPADVAARLAPVPVEEVPALPNLAVPAGVDALWHGELRLQLEQTILPAYLKSQRWFGSKGRPIQAVRIAECQEIPAETTRLYLVLLEVAYLSGKKDTYFVPLGVSQGRAAAQIKETHRRFAIAELTGQAATTLLHDALAADDACTALLESVERAESRPAAEGHIRALPTTAYQQLRGETGQRLPIVRAAATSSNSLVLFGRRLLMKVFRRLEPGINPDVEVGRYFTQSNAFKPTPRLAGTLEYDRGLAGTFTLAIFQAMVSNQGDGWEHAIDELGRYFQRAAGRMRGPDQIGPDPRSPLELVDADPPPVVLETIGGFLHAAEMLGQRTAEMHLALAANHDDAAFAPDPFLADDFAHLVTNILEQGRTALQLLTTQSERLPDDIAEEAQRVLQEAPRRLAEISLEAALGLDTKKIRCHGDYHLGQVLRVENDFVILDFEGEPTRSVDDRRAKQSPLKDIAGMLRSYSYAAYAGLFAFGKSHPHDVLLLEPWAEIWQQWVSAAFLRAYLRKSAGAPYLPPVRTELAALLNLFIFDKALYELAYEVNNRPDWVRIPLRGILPLLHPAYRSA
jgi:maltose alpha-D-glucosyltransferase/alpha-amylase